MIVNSPDFWRQLRTTELRLQAVIAFASLGDFITVADDGTLGASPHTVTGEHWVALERFDVDDRPVAAKKGGGRIRRLRIRMACKVKALDALARHLGLFGGTPSPDDATAEPQIIPPLAAGERRPTPNFAVSAERLRDEYARVAFATMNHFIESEPGGSWRLVLPHAEPDKLATLRELVVDQHIGRPDGAPPVILSMNLKLADKLRALGALARLPSWLHTSGAVRPATEPLLRAPP